VSLNSYLLFGYLRYNTGRKKWELKRIDEAPETHSNLIEESNEGRSSGQNLVPRTLEDFFRTPSAHASVRVSWFTKQLIGATESIYDGELRLLSGRSYADLDEAKSGGRGSKDQPDSKGNAKPKTDELAKNEQPEKSGEKLDLREAGSQGGGSKGDETQGALVPGASGHAPERVLNSFEKAKDLVCPKLRRSEEIFGNGYMKLLLQTITQLENARENVEQSRESQICKEAYDQEITNVEDDDGGEQVSVGLCPAAKTKIWQCGKGKDELCSDWEVSKMLETGALEKAQQAEGLADALAFQRDVKKISRHLTRVLALNRFDAITHVSAKAVRDAANKAKEANRNTDNVPDDDSNCDIEVLQEEERTQALREGRELDVDAFSGELAVRALDLLAAAEQDFNASGDEAYRAAVLVCKAGTALVDELVARAAVNTQPILQRIQEKQAKRESAIGRNELEARKSGQRGVDKSHPATKSILRKVSQEFAKLRQTLVASQKQLIQTRLFASPIENPDTEQVNAIRAAVKAAKETREHGLTAFLTWIRDHRHDRVAAALDEQTKVWTEIPPIIFVKWY